MAPNPLSYIKESKAELDKVVWPTRKETLRLTIVVTFVSIVVGLYISGLDTIFTSLVDNFLK